MNYVKGMLGYDTTETEGGDKGIMGSVMDYMKSAMGYDDLKVVDPTGDSKEQSHTEEERNQLWSMVGQYVGGDIVQMHLSLPVWLFEPSSILQKMCESMEYSDILDRAAASKDNSMRMAYLAAFAASCYSNSTRTFKPFNPLLGETFEWIRKDKKIKFLAEQVSHHPPISASVTESDGFTLNQEFDVKTKFWGNSVEAYMQGMTHVTFKDNGDHYSWTPATTCVHNLILGKMWMDHYGEVVITNHTTGEKCIIKFTQCGWFSAGRHEVKGACKDASGKDTLLIEGKWNDKMVGTPVGGDPVVLWEKQNTEATMENLKKFGYNQFAQEMNEDPADGKAVLPETDARLRADRIALQDGDMTKAGAEKTRLEEEQRAKRKNREEQGVEYKPKYFQKKDDAPGGKLWEYIGSYWEEREARKSA